MRTPWHGVGLERRQPPLLREVGHRRSGAQAGTRVYHRVAPPTASLDRRTRQGGSTPLGETGILILTSMRHEKGTDLAKPPLL